MDIMTKEESYADRRQLFKNIWDTAMQIDEKDADIMSKPKIIKTLRLSEVDRCRIGKKKKERIRNLRTVCNKILDFCDRQDADDIFYEQMAEGKEPPQHKFELNRKKIKIRRGKKRVKKEKTSVVPNNIGGDQPMPATSERNDNIYYPKIFTKISRPTSPIKMKRNTVIRRTIVRHRTSKVKSSSNAEGNNILPTKGSTVRRKIVRKKHSKRKKTSAPNVSPPRPSGASNNVRYVSTPLSGRAIRRRINQLITENKIQVTNQMVPRK